MLVLWLYCIDEDGDGIISRADLHRMLDKITDSPGLDQKKKDRIITNVIMYAPYTILVAMQS